jgi:phosphoglycolate phosphatase-like HAD superfamily hydrolase
MIACPSHRILVTARQGRVVKHRAHRLRAPAAAASAVKACTQLAKDEGPTALQGTGTFLLDCDGVIWRGTEVLPGVPKALQAFRQRGIQLFFLTNNSSKSRAQYAPAKA